MTMVQMRVRMRMITVCEGLNLPTQMRRSCVIASGRSRMPSAAKSGRCCYKKNKHKRLCLHVVRHDVHVSVSLNWEHTTCFMSQNVLQH